MQKLLVLICFFCLALVISSCTSPRATTYFQEIPTTKIDSLIPPQAHMIQPGDLLQVSVSSLSPEADVPFSHSGLSQGSTVSGYLVDSAGRIELPYVGLINVSGQSTMSARDDIRSRLTPFLKDPSVNIRVLNYRISVLGEVMKPGQYNIPAERVTLPEALSLSGDLTINGRRDNVMVVREVSGKRIFQRIDLKKADVFLSPFYYLRSGDIVYVEPGKGKVAESDTRKWQFITFVTTVVSLGVVIFSRIN